MSRAEKQDAMIICQIAPLVKPPCQFFCWAKMAKRFVDPNKTCGENHLRDTTKMVCPAAINFVKLRR